jgi:hypothetical protein
MSAVLGTVETTGFALDVGGVTTSAIFNGPTPSAVVNGDAMIAVFAADNSGDAQAGFVAPVGWNEISVVTLPTTPRPPLAAWWKAASREPATQDFEIPELVAVLRLARPARR